MNKNHLILLTAGILLLVYLSAKSNKVPEPVEIIKPGDKGNDVFGLQNALSSISGVKLGNMGVYDSETLAAVQYYMRDTTSLLDFERGYIKKSFAADLYLIQNAGKK